MFLVLKQLRSGIGTIEYHTAVEQTATQIPSVSRNQARKLHGTIFDFPSLNKSLIHSSFSKQRSSSHTSTRVKAKPPADISDADPMQQIGSFVNIESKRNRYSYGFSCNTWTDELTKCLHRNKKRSKKKTEEVELQQQPVFQQDYSGAFIWSETEVSSCLLDVNNH